MQAQNQFIKTGVVIFLGYFRWTQLTPMLLMWGAGIVMLLAITFINFQEQSFSIFEKFMEWLMKLPIVGDDITEFLTEKSREQAANVSAESNPDESIHVGTSDFKSLIFRAWGIVSLVFMLLGMLLSALFGPFKPWTLKRKLGLAFLGVMALLAGFIANYFAASHNFNGGTGSWMFNFSMIALLIFVVSLYCLTISHLIGLFSKGIMESELREFRGHPQVEIISGHNSLKEQDQGELK